MPAFARTIGIDYSGAETPSASVKGLRVYLAEGDQFYGQNLIESEHCFHLRETCWQWPGAVRK